MSCETKTLQLIENEGKSMWEMTERCLFYEGEKCTHLASTLSIWRPYASLSLMTVAHTEVVWVLKDFWHWSSRTITFPIWCQGGSTAFVTARIQVKWLLAVPRSQKKFTWHRDGAPCTKKLCSSSGGWGGLYVSRVPRMLSGYEGGNAQEVRFPAHIHTHITQSQDEYFPSKLLPVKAYCFAGSTWNFSGPSMNWAFAPAPGHSTSLRSKILGAPLLILL